MALIINASDIAYLIPPSIAMILYGTLANVSVAELFIAGIGPGIVLALLFSAYCYVYSLLQGDAIMRFPKIAAPCQTPNRLTSNRRRMSSSLTSGSGVRPIDMPALLINTSIRP